jgi:hypothetical protein
MHLSNLGPSLKIPLRYKSGSCIRKRSQTTIATISYCGIGELPGVASASQTNYPLHLNPTASVTNCRKIKLFITTTVSG